MNHKRPPLPAIIVLAVLVLIGIYFIGTQVMNNSDGALAASGTIETIQVNIAPELAGKVTEVLVAEGQSVRTGEPLLRMDESLLAAQRAVAAAQAETAKAALAASQTQYDLTLQNALKTEQASTARDWLFSAPDQFNQPRWYFTLPEEIASGQAEAEAARNALTAAQAELQKVISDLNNADFLKAEKRLADARAGFLVADDVKTDTDNAVEGGGVQKAGDAAYLAASEELRQAQNAYNALLKSRSATAVENARGKVVVGRQRYDTAYARLLSLQTGTFSPAVLAATRALDQAGSGVAQAEANLALLDTQIRKLTITSPTDGVVLTRNVEVGEFIQPGATSFVLGQLSELTITVYVPEDRFGEIKIGQTALVSVDSFPGVTFTATVIQIADKAEFTPRNVQTVKGRSSTVYAIKLSIRNPDGRLKIGMPADVLFNGQ